jgi:ApbE superfamily uncharacterized protein (UPF0280 family)
MNNKLAEVRRRFKESNILFKSDNPQAIDVAIESIKLHRRRLEKYVISNSNLLYTLRPLAVPNDAPRIVRIMGESTRPLNIGPMAAVAGAMADLAVESMLSLDVEVAIVENGGEISAFSRRRFHIGLYAGMADLSLKIGFQIDPSKHPIGVGTSSGTVGTAFSFGEADAATVFANTAALADAAATAICNEVRGSDVTESIQRGLNFAKTLDFIRGAIIIRGGFAGVVGQIPRIVQINKTSKAVSLDRYFSEVNV